MVKVIVASPSSAQEDTAKSLKTESMRLQPKSPYASSMVAAETMTLAFSASYGMDAIVLRHFGMYDPRQRGGSYAGVNSAFVETA